jgi:hypothetical protein
MLLRASMASCFGAKGQYACPYEYASYIAVKRGKAIPATGRGSPKLRRLALELYRPSVEGVAWSVRRILTEVFSVF